jgi:hypothetical protein
MGAKKYIAAEHHIQCPNFLLPADNPPGIKPIQKDEISETLLFY